MLSFGWSEMMVIAVLALIVVGPKDLPRLLREVGRMVGTVRRMGNDFRREINKVAALDEVTNIKKSITEPLSQTKTDIEREFNAITPKGMSPTGALKPAKEGSESVFDEIRTAAGMDNDAGISDEDFVKSGGAAKASMIAKMRKVQAAEKQSGAAKAGAAKSTAKKPAVKKPAVKKTTAKKTAVSKVTAAKSASSKAAPVKASAAKKAATTKPATAKATTGAGVAKAPAKSAKPRAPRKPAVKPADASASKKS